MKLKMIITGIILLALLFWSVRLIWVNIYDEKITQIGIKILLLAIVTSSILITFQILSPLPSESKTVDVLLFRNGKVVEDFYEKLLKVGSPHKNGYGLLHKVNIFFPKNEDIKIEQGVIAIDLLG